MYPKFFLITCVWNPSFGFLQASAISWAFSLVVTVPTVESNRFISLSLLIVFFFWAFATLRWHTKLQNTSSNYCQINIVKYWFSPLVYWAKKICGLLAQNQMKRKSMVFNARQPRFHIWKSGFHIWKCEGKFILSPCTWFPIRPRESHQYIMMRWCVAIRLRKLVTRSA